MRNTIIACVLGLSLFAPFSGHAQHTGAEDVLLEKIDKENNPGLVRTGNVEEGILNILGYILSFVGIIMLALIIWSGFRWMMSGGKQEVIEESRSTLVRAVIGFAIIMLAFVIVQTFIRVTENPPAETVQQE